MKKQKSLISDSIRLFNVKSFFNEILTEHNIILAFWKLKLAGLINSTYTVNSTVHILQTVSEWAIDLFY